MYRYCAQLHLHINLLSTGKKNRRTHTLSTSTQTPLKTHSFFFSYRLCGKGWSPLSSPPTPAGPAPSERWPVAWCQVHTGSCTCTASAWSQRASNHTCGRSHRCRRWWRSSRLLHWLWRTCDLWMEWEKLTSVVAGTATPKSNLWYWSIIETEVTKEQIRNGKMSKYISMCISGETECNCIKLNTPQMLNIVRCKTLFSLLLYLHRATAMLPRDHFTVICDKQYFPDTNNALPWSLPKTVCQICVPLLHPNAYKCRYVRCATNRLLSRICLSHVPTRTYMYFITFIRPWICKTNPISLWLLQICSQRL